MESKVRAFRQVTSDLCSYFYWTTSGILEDLGTSHRMTHQEQGKSFSRCNWYQGFEYRGYVIKNSRCWTCEAALVRRMNRTSPASLVERMSLNVATSEGRKEGVVTIDVVREAVYE